MIPNLPFSVMNLERMVRDLPVKTIIIDERIEPDYESVIVKHKDNLLMAGVSSMSGYQMISGKKFSQFIKKTVNTPIVWGGWFPSVTPEIALNEDFIDIVIVGQGEIAFRELVIGLLQNTDISSIPGLGLKENGITINEPGPLIDEKLLPNVSLDIIEINKIIEINGCSEPKYRSLNYIVGSGCPYNCKFCCLPTIWKQRSFCKDINTVMNDLKKINKDYDVHKLGFNDDNFFSRQSFVMQLCDQMIKNDISIEWEANAHIDYFLRNFTTEDISVLYEAGCRSIKFGVESGDQEILEKINKKTTVESCRAVAKLLADTNIKCVFYIMVAFPWNPDKDFKLTLDFLSDVKLINKKLEVGINFFIPLPKTPLYEVAIDYGFTPFTDFDNMIEFISAPYQGPWWNKDYRKELYDFIWFYFKYANPNHYLTKNDEIIKLSRIVNKIFYPLSVLRLKTKCRRFRLDARFYFFAKKIFNKFSKYKFASNAETIGRCRSWNR